MKKIFLIALLLLSSCWCVNAADKQNDLLDLANGALLLTYSTQYSESWPALGLLAGGSKPGWASEGGQPFPHSFVIELDQRYQLNSFVIDNRGAQEASYPGISAKGFRLESSNRSATKGFELVLQAEAAQGDRKEFSLPKKADARWLKLTILSNYGDANYTEIMELEAYGASSKTPKQQAPLSGVYDTNYGLLLFNQDGDQVLGCYDHDGGQLSGATDGRVMRFEWREHGPQIGTAIMVVSADGNFVNGLWYEDAVQQGTWFGQRASSGSRPNCSVKTGTLAETLKASGRALLYGIYFDHDSAEINPGSLPTLNQIADALGTLSSQHVEISGHTDATGDDVYNRTLSQQRAESVVKWLAQKGLLAGRLSAKGYGESQPVADNSTPQGKALNRRVEILIP